MTRHEYGVMRALMWFLDDLRAYVYPDKRPPKGICEVLDEARKLIEAEEEAVERKKSNS